MVLELKPMGKLTTERNLNFGQNQGIAWSSDSNLWGNQLLERNLSFGQNQGIAWSSNSNLWGNQLLKGDLDTRLGLTICMASQMMPISPQKCVQAQIQRPMGAGKLEFRDMIPNTSYARPFIHVKITSSKIRRSATIVSISKGT